MAQSLEQYVAEATNAYKPSATAIQTQLDNLGNRLDATTEAIERDYAQQQANLNNLSNQAAESASMQAAGSGGSFGGAANLANRKYYEQSFVPAQTQLKTNRSNDIAAARQANEDSRNALTTQLANLNAQANQQALAQYYTDLGAEQARDFQAQQADLDRKFNEAQNQLNREWEDYLADKRYKNEAVEAEKVRQFQAAQAQLEREYNAQQAELDRNFQAQQNAANRAASSSRAYASSGGADTSKYVYSLDSNKNLYGGYNWRDGNGNLVRVGQVAASTPGDFNDNLYQRLRQAATNGEGDWYSAQVYNEMSDGARFAINESGQPTGNAMYDTLGIRRIN